MFEASAQESSPSAQQPLRVLLHSRTVIQGESTVATGVLSYIEGDLMEVELPEYEQFELGEQVKITMYSPVGMFTFMTKIIARHLGSLLFVNPPQHQKKFADKREHPRVEARNSGIASIFKSSDGNGSDDQLSQMTIDLLDISLNGLGFLVAPHCEWKIGHKLNVELDLGFKLQAEVYIIRQEQKESALMCGGTLELMDNRTSRALRAFILRRQVEIYVHSKKPTLG
ncbi:PilZ domain-containing protein [Paenibacillus sp. SC116]|uniref:PilZ domain-containing protein n=1 Tax=Paenibacillus sp. SC116 TaxID=2968986 RepID=UPI00215B2F71|nr:PilZ domain-containing protein [Paenibacillus sp. SC116]MCR8846294.1 PilZ domain-containing protein [Paenibacillus sp. SC116]